MNKSVLLLVSAFCFMSIATNAQKRSKKDNQTPNSYNQNVNQNKFRQLDYELPTPNVYRTASGAPGHQYWQNTADYVMDIRLDDENQRVYGTEEITYTNASPDKLEYLWIQLDQNMRNPESETYQIQQGKISDGVGLYEYFNMFHTFPGGFNIDYVNDESGKAYDVKVNHTMMRVDLDKPLKSGESVKVNIKWWYNINDRMEIGGRSGYEYFKEEDNYLYTIAQFFPRMAVYSDVTGWQNKQFLGRGEFTLPFGDYDVKLNVPSDMVVGATGEIQNTDEVLTETQQARLEKAKTSDKPLIIVTQDEAIANEKSKATDTKTWHFKAENVRDYGWCASRKFIWDAQGVQFGDRTVMAMSLYPKEGNPMWEMYSTKAIVLTLETYSKFTFDYPYPVAYSINGKSIGMEYPMICFNGGRTDAEGKFSDAVKYRTILVIIHEVGHNYFPMIINSDERQWTWMDEGLNTFLQYQTEKKWSDETGKAFPSRRGPANKIVPYMGGDKRYISPIMSNSESINQFGNNAYGKPCTALNILRETVMGPELFDHAFKTYSNRWMFKHPSPADLFRTMEDASAVDLDWFWRGWFYTTDHCDVAMTGVKEYRLKFNQPNEGTSKKKVSKMVKKQTKLGEFDPILQSIARAEDPAKAYELVKGKVTDTRKDKLNENAYFYQVDLKMIGGLVMPVIFKLDYADGTSKEVRIPAEIWKMQNEGLTETVSKVLISNQEITKITLDPNLETADTDTTNNVWVK
ncbi:M1 family metallopeptidase [Bacteroidia bacterium]|nr:M1 family metallopeptidase [Bacteroidia bacterium]MDB9882966.1 M1 family metallopeptidase [Bacteroidia bacterium]